MTHRKEPCQAQEIPLESNTMTDKNRLPSISILTPTLNAAGVLEECLKSITEQDYPKELTEIIIADGGSKDNTVEIAKKYGAKVIPNPLKTGEAGKMAALRCARGELIALIDSDNILPHPNWLKQMVQPLLDDPEIIGSEPIRFTWRPEDGFITRYCALIGANDPLVMFLGNYDRFNTLTGKWTELAIQQEDRGDYIVVTLSAGLNPTIGANGTILRRKPIIEHVNDYNYLFDIDVLYELTSKMERLKFAKVKTGIIHLYCGSNVITFYKKQRRRIKDFMFYESLGVRKYPWRVFGWNTPRGRNLILFILATGLVIPTSVQAIIGYTKTKRRDPAWFFHPLACLITLYAYGTNTIKKYLGAKPEVQDRSNYGQFFNSPQNPINKR